MTDTPSQKIIKEERAKHGNICMWSAGGHLCKCDMFVRTMGQAFHEDNAIIAALSAALDEAKDELAGAYVLFDEAIRQRDELLAKAKEEGEG